MWGLDRRRLNSRISCRAARDPHTLLWLAAWCPDPVVPFATVPDPGLATLSVLCRDCRECFTPGEVHTCMVLPTRLDAERLRSHSSSSASAGTLLQPFPELLEFLCLTSLPDGTKRSPGKMSLSLESGMWQVALSDLETSLYACLTGEDLDCVLLTVEERLRAGSMPWRPSRYGVGKSKGKR
jgi:hypothetical protein